MGRIAERLGGGALSLLTVVGGAAGSVPQQPVLEQLGKDPGIIIDCADPAHPLASYKLPIAERDSSVSMRMGGKGGRTVVVDQKNRSLTVVPQLGDLPSTRVESALDSKLGSITVIVATRGKPTYRMTMTPDGLWGINAFCGDAK